MLWWLKDAPAPGQAAAAVPAEPVAPAAPAAPGPSDDRQSSVSDVALSVPADTSLDAGPLPDPAATSPASLLEDVVARALPAVVSIQAGRGRGTGFFVQRDIVLTNQHVVGNETSVQLNVGNKSYQARVITSSPSTDLAVLQVYGPDPAQPTLRLGSAKSLRAGQEVVAIG